MAPPDEKTGALEKQVDAGFAHLERRMDVESARNDERFKAVGERFDLTDRRIDEVKDGLAALDARFAALQRTIIQIGGGLLGVMIIALATVLVALLAQI